MPLRVVRPIVFRPVGLVASVMLLLPGVGPSCWWMAVVPMVGVVVVVVPVVGLATTGMGVAVAAWAGAVAGCMRTKSPLVGRGWACVLSVDGCCRGWEIRCSTAAQRGCLIDELDAVEGSDHGLGFSEETEDMFLVSRSGAFLQ